MMIRYELCHEKPYFFCMLTMKMLISLHIHVVAKKWIRASIVHSLVCTVPQSCLHIQNWLTKNVVSLCRVQHGQNPNGRVSHDTTDIRSSKSADSSFLLAFGN